MDTPLTTGPEWRPAGEVRTRLHAEVIFIALRSGAVQHDWPHLPPDRPPMHTVRMSTDPEASEHVAGLIAAISAMDLERISRWGDLLGRMLPPGGRLLVAGNGGSAAEAQHLTAELVGRYRMDRRPLSAIALHAESSSVTALGNDFGFDEVFARQVRAHGRPGDVLLVLSASGRSANLLHAVEAARAGGLTTWAMTGRAPNPLADLADECLAVEAGSAANVQECHLAAIHILCGVIDQVVAGRRAVEPRRGLVVVGDVLLDQDLSGEVDRLAPDAPVPVLTVHRTEQRPGGAGLAAVLAARTGRPVTLVTALGRGPDAGTARRLLEEAGVAVVDVGTDAEIPVKTRVRAGGQILLRLEQVTPPGPRDALPPAALAALRSATAVLVADYGRGLAAGEELRRELAALVGRVPIVWDPHPRGAVPVPGISMVTPNDREVRHWQTRLGGEQPAESSMAADVAMARRLREAWQVGHLVVTRGSRGAVMVADDSSPPLVVPPPVVSTGDPCGAGDQLAVSLAVALGSGRVPSEALRDAVEAATWFVERDTPRPADVDPVALAARVRAAGGTVVATGGCFDLLHRGHLALLQHARQLGDCLVVCLNGDASVTRLKGESRPLVTAEDRASVLTALSTVDGVLIFDDDTPAEALARLRPHVYVKGGDYAIADIPERHVVEAGGGQVVLVPYLDGRSTTSLIEQASRATVPR